ncbi:MAG: peptidase M36 [Nocardioides sp.]|nr:peptidase M36 [Nocardioides sp.]
MTRTPRRRLVAAAAVSSVAVMATLLPSPSTSAAAVPDEQRPVGVGASVLGAAEGVIGLRDLDLRGSARPTAVQKRAARALDKRLGVDLRWNSFGTPSSILPSTGPLGRGPKDAPVATARRWLAANAALFGLSAADMKSLELVSDQPLAMGGGNAVLFRQRFGGLSTSRGSMVTVGVAKGRIEYVSSSLARAGSGTSVADARLTPRQAWKRAAATIGYDLSESTLSGIVDQAVDGWSVIKVPGFLQRQQVRLRALALANGTVRPVLETNVIDSQGGNALAYTLMVDAVTGKIWTRQNQVEAQNDAFTYTGTYTATTCGPKHSFTLTDNATRSIVILGTAVNPVNDITLNLYNPAGQVIASQDLLTSPEALTYSAASIPAGDYAAQVCPFDGTALVPPANYSMTVTTTNQEIGGAGGSSQPEDGQAGNPRWRYFPANPTPDFRTTTTPRNTSIVCWFKTSGCTLPTGAVRNVAAPGPWDSLTTTGMSTFTTTGNNATTHEAWASPLTPGGLAQAPISLAQQYTTQFTDAWNNSGCSPTELVPTGNDIDFVTGNLFVSHNRMHDWSYYLGFTEESYNMQLDNLGRGGVDADPEVGNVQAGALTGGQPSLLGRDNANQITLQDGVPGITNQYLFQPIAGAFYAPCSDGSLDMGIVGHEYTHAISNRMVGGPDEGLTTEHGGAMGESWSDLAAAEYQFSHGYDTGGNVFAVGSYATGNKSVAIRDYAINKNPLNFSNYGFDTTGPEVHADGEIWNGINYEVRQALVKAYNKKFPYKNETLQLKCAQAGAVKGVVRPQKCPGNRRWIQLVFDAFLLQQGATSMVDARDAMLAADRMRFGGDNQDLLWAAFARRGLGSTASVKDGEDVSPKPSFRTPTGKDNTKVVFKTSGQGNLYVGDYEARVTPVADTYKKTKRGAAVLMTPGRYDMLFVGNTHGFMRFTVKVPAGKRRTVVRLNTTKNLAAARSGAKVISATAGSINPEQLIDGTEDASWGSVNDSNVDAANPSVAVDLAGGKHTIRTVAVSAMLRPATSADGAAGSRFTALRRFAIEACTTGCGSSNARWKRVFTSKPNAFPGARPRPVAPNLNMRAFRIKPTKAAALRLVVLENQCTGFAGYAGEQDSDPLNDTDCKTASDRGTIVHVAEMQAFTRNFGSWKSSYGINNAQRSFR